MTTKTIKGAKNVKIANVEAKTILATVKELDAAKVVSEVGNLQLSIQSTLANLSASITSKMAQIETIEAAIKLKESRLQELYGIEQEAVTLDDMKAQIESEAIRADNERKERNAQWSEEENDHKKRYPGMMPKKLPHRRSCLCLANKWQKPCKELLTMEENRRRTKNSHFDEKPRFRSGFFAIIGSGVKNILLRVGSWWIKSRK